MTLSRQLSALVIHVCDAQHGDGELELVGEVHAGGVLGDLRTTCLSACARARRARARAPRTMPTKSPNITARGRRRATARRVSGASRAPEKRLRRLHAPQRPLPISLLLVQPNTDASLTSAANCCAVKNLVSSFAFSRWNSVVTGAALRGAKGVSQCAAGAGVRVQGAHVLAGVSLAAARVRTAARACERAGAGAGVVRGRARCRRAPGPCGRGTRARRGVPRALRPWAGRRGAPGARPRAAARAVPCRPAVCQPRRGRTPRTAGRRHGSAALRCAATQRGEAARGRQRAAARQRRVGVASPGKVREAQNARAAPRRRGGRTRRRRAAHRSPAGTGMPRSTPSLERDAKLRGPCPPAAPRTPRPASPRAGS
jgi:hypothetical protein